MNFEITSLAEIMNVVEFTNELDNRNIYWAIEECDNAMDYNEGDCLLRVGDLVYSFSNGELLDVHVMDS